MEDRGRERTQVIKMGLTLNYWPHQAEGTHWCKSNKSATGGHQSLSDWDSGPVDRREFTLGTINLVRSPGLGGQSP